MIKKQKIYWWGFCSLLVLSFAFYYVGPEQIANNFSDTDQLDVNVFDVGQGDAIFIETPDNFQILIDGGPDKSILGELGEVMGFWDRNINAVVLTHPHADHVGGLVEVLRRYKIEKIYMTGVVHTSSDYIEFLNTIKEKDINIHIVDSAFDLELDNGIDLEFLYPLESYAGLKVDNLNNTSIVNRLVYNNSAVLFMGDLEAEGEEELILSEADLAAEVLKAGHHGSATSSHLEFLEVVNPDVALISCGIDNTFHHPSMRTINRMERLGIEILRTDELGRVSLTSSGSGWEMFHE